MPVSVTMPQLGESVSEGTVTRWLKKEGDHVETDEPLLEVSTEKVDTEIPSPASGTLQSISVSEDETVEVGTEIGTIAEEGAAATGATTAAAGTAAAQAPAETPEPGPQPEPQQPQPAAEQPPAEEPAAPAATEQAPPQQPPAADQVQPGQQPPAPPAAEQPPAAQPAQPAQPPQPAQPEEQAAATPYVTPLVRKLAAEHNVDLSAVEGTGVGGRIRKQDVLDAARAQQPQAPAAPETTGTQPPGPQAPQAPQAAPQAAAPPAPAAAPGPEAAQLRGRTEKLSRMRSVIAQRMTESLQTSAQLTTVVEVDVTRIAQLRERAKADFEAREGVKLTFLPFFAQATTEALKQHPKLNASIDTDRGEVTYYDAEHLGIAVDTERGLIVPVIRDAGDLNLGGLARNIADLADRTRAARVSPDELSGGTFTLTNIGSRGAITDTPIINQPQVGVLGTGKVVRRPLVIDDPELGEVITVRSVANFPLTYDHRLVDGADAARFLNTIKARLEEGNFEGELGLT